MEAFPLVLRTFATKFSCAGISIEGAGVVINNLAGSNHGSDCPANTGLSVLVWQVLYSSHTSETAPWRLSWLPESIVRKTVSIVCPSAQKCIDNCPPPLLLSVPRDSRLVARKTGCPLSSEFDHHQFSDSVPFSSWSLEVSRIPLLFWSKSEEWPKSCWKIFLQIQTRVWR